MRNLTIQRRKAFAASFVKMKVYLEDRQSGDTIINGVPCRLLGRMKNGETVTFQIPNTAGMLFVVQGKRSASYSSEALPIFEGEYDIFLSGQNQFDFTSGHAFRFDNITLDATLAHRAQTAKKGKKVMILSLVLGIILGIALVFAASFISASPRTFSEKNFTITLTHEFEIEHDEYFYLGFESDDYAVTVDRVSKRELAANVNTEIAAIDSLEEYARYIEQLDNDVYKTQKPVTKKGDLLYYEYQYTYDDDTYYCAVYYYETDGYYWQVDFIAEKREFKAATVAKWAGSVSVQ